VSSTARSGAPRGAIEVALEHVDLERGGRAVLRDVSWRIRAGERWLLAGPNGAGKTQLLKLVAGAVWPAPGRRARVRHRLGGVWHATPEAVLDHIAYVGPERQDRHDRYGWNATVERLVATGWFHTDIPLHPLDGPARRAVATSLRRFGIASLARRRFLSLSYGERRLALLARALAARPGLLLLDEVFTGLDAVHRQRVLAALAGLSRRRMTWILSAHRAADVPPGLTHHLQLDAGRVVRRGRLSASVLASSFAPLRPVSYRPAPRRRVARGPAVLLVRFERARVFLDGACVLRGLSATLRAGEAWVVHGPNGAGKTTLLRTIHGDHGVAWGGRIVRHGVSPGIPLGQFRRRLGLVAPHLQADHALELTAEEVVVSGLRASVGLDEAPTRAERRRARRALRACGAVGIAARAVRELSYGQLRRVLFARALAGEPRLLLLDEPYAGLDVATRTALRRRVDALVGEGVAVVLALHHRDEWPGHTSHEIELDRGVVRYAGPIRYHPPP
jgi:molybdate transport system ATP-binding protein